jgi:hypothetical protein
LGGVLLILAEVLGILEEVVDKKPAKSTRNVKKKTSPNYLGGAAKKVK